MSRSNGSSGSFPFLLAAALWRPSKLSTESLESLGETEAAQRAHAAYFQRLAEEAEQGMTGPQQAVLLERLEQEHGNLRAAMQWSTSQAEEGNVMALRLGGALFSFWYGRGYFSEGRDFLERALTLRDEVPTPVRAKALYAASQLQKVLGFLDRAEACCEQSLALYRELEDTLGIASCLHLLYASAIRKGAPQAEQVSDRWHILKNLAACVCVQMTKIVALPSHQPSNRCNRRSEWLAMNRLWPCKNRG